MSKASSIPDSHTQIGYVSSMEEFLSAEFYGAVNAIVLRRDLKGDFDGLAQKIANKSSSWKVGAHALRWMLNKDPLTPFEKEAAGHLLKDMSERELNLTISNAFDNGETESPSDFDFHVDEGGGSPARIICAYNQVATEWTPNEDVFNHIDLSHYLPDETFFFTDDEFLKMDVPRYRFGLGDLIKFRVQTGYCVDNQDRHLGLIHRAPDISNITAPRLFAERFV